MSLRERRDMVSLAREVAAGCLVTLVRADGPSYRRPGARLFALEDGRTAGSISGGCLEADLLRKAAWHLRDGATMLRYDTAFDDEADMPFGLGCGGTVDLLLEDVQSGEARAALDALAATLPVPSDRMPVQSNASTATARRGEVRMVVTQLPSHPLGFARIVLDATGDVLFATDSLETDRIVDLRRIARSGAWPESSARLENGARLGDGTADRVHVYVETLLPAQRLIVCGAGDDARPVVRLAADMGWNVAVVDGRAHQARPERFPQADAIFTADTLQRLDPAAGDAVVVMTHSFQQDSRFVAELLRMSEARRPRYIGLLGARARSALLLEAAARDAGISFEEAVAAVHAPVGLDLRGDGPDSIALAVVAQIQHFTQADAQGLGPAAGERLALHQRMSLPDAFAALARVRQQPANPFQCALDTAGAATDHTDASHGRDMHNETAHPGDTAAAAREVHA